MITSKLWTSTWLEPAGTKLGLKCKDVVLTLQLPMELGFLRRKITIQIIQTE